MNLTGKTQRVEYAAEFDLSERGDNHSFGGIVLNMLFNVCFGAPESGQSGPPENYDPGSGDEVSLFGVEVSDREGLFKDAFSVVICEALARAWLARNKDTIIAEAFEQAQAEYERAMERQAEQRADMRRERA